MLFLKINNILFFKHDRIYDSILKCRWYLLPKESQLDMLIMMIAAQKYLQLSVLNIYPLDLNLFASVC